MAEYFDNSQNENAFSTSWLERNYFPTWLYVFIWIIVSFILFQVVGSVISLVLVYAKTGSIQAMSNMSTLSKYLGVVFIGNSTAQILFIGLATIAVSRLAAPKGQTFEFLGFQHDSDTGKMILLAVVLFLTIQPFIWFLSWLNLKIPFPESYLHFEHMQDQMLQNFLSGNKMVPITLFHVALVPAICEETMYRGFVLNALKKKWGIVLAVVVSGVMFALYHVRFTQFIPLAALGILLAILAWKSKSIYPAMAAHFINNGFSVIIAYEFPNYAFSKVNTTSMPPVIWVVISVIISSYLLYILFKGTLLNSEGAQHV